MSSIGCLVAEQSFCMVGGTAEYSHSKSFRLWTFDSGLWTWIVTNQEDRVKLCRCTKMMLECFKSQQRYQQIASDHISALCSVKWSLLMDDILTVALQHVFIILIE